MNILYRSSIPVHKLKTCLSSHHRQKDNRLEPGPTFIQFSSARVFTMKNIFVHIGLAASITNAVAAKHSATEDIAGASAYTLYQFPDSGSWIANLVGRQNSGLVVTRADVPEVWVIDAHDGTAEHIATIPDVSSLIGITAIDGDVFVVIGGNLSLETLEPQPGSFTVWKVDLDYNSVDVSLITAIPEAKFLHGVTMFRRFHGITEVLIADAAQSAVYRLNTDTAEYSIALQDDIHLAGANNIQLHNGYLYYTSTPNKFFGRVRVNWHDASVRGNFQTIFNNSGLIPDGFALSRNGKAAYMATLQQNSVVKIDLDDDRHDVVTIYGGENSTSIPGPTTVLRQRNGQRDILYVPTNGGLAAPVNGTYTEPAKVVAIEI